ncbi:MAG TPA: competence/damage-inducible protein A [Flavisolibacter sp.]|nr:competence/damage-inducible protein A [Flavisolibacter sp.]
MNEVNASIITIGDELLIGQTIDTNSAFIAQELNKIGIWVKRRLAIGDVRGEIEAALSGQSRDSRIIIITGGLGPTADDITKPTLSEYFGGKLVINDEALQNVKDIFNRLGRPLTERNLKQAEVPDVCTVLPNRRGTAPGMWFEKEGVIYVSLPGVPNEMKGLMLDSVIPALKAGLQLPAVSHRTLLTAGIGESMLADAIRDFEAGLPAHIKLAYLPAYGLVRLRLTGRLNDAAALDKELDSLFLQLKQQVKEWMVASEDIGLEEAVNRLLAAKGKTLATAESCTGGYIAHLITSVPGSSAIFKGGVVSYANEVKEDMLGVPSQILQAHGAVSEATVTAMASGIIEKLGAGYAIATSGIMGPGGGSPEKPVGTVWVAVGNQKRIVARKLFFRFGRERNIELTAHAALTMLYRFVVEEEGEWVN